MWQIESLLIKGNMVQIADTDCAEERGEGFTGRTRRGNAARARGEQQPQTHLGSGDFQIPMLEIAESTGSARIPLALIIFNNF